ncbi:MAG: restriction endonuclease subunit S [Polaromonas sp.]
MSQTVDVPEGYKLTEVGVIPGDWEVRKLGELATFRTGPFGSALHKSDYTSNGVPIVNPMHIIEGQIVPTQSMTITEQAATTLSEFRLKPGEVVIGRRGDMGRCAVVGNEHLGWLCGTGSMIIRPSVGVDADFLQRVLSSPSVVSAIEETSVGSTMINLNQATLSGLDIQAPPIFEQRAIAAALSDVDALLAKLDQLIAKKQGLKQAAMQQLLTGQTRLPGFSEEWIEQPLGDIAPLQRGFDLPNSQQKRGPYPVVYSNGIGNHHAAFQVKGPGVVTGRSGTIGAVTYVEKDFWPHNTSLWVKTFKGNDAKFVFYLYMHIGLERFATGSGVPTLNRNDVHLFKMSIPASKAEQTAIATVLSDMDAELAALQARHDKTRALKQGMMQALLTGRIRLV